MEQTKALNALEPFLALSKSATSPRAAADLIIRATSAPNTYVFAELLETPSIQALGESEQYSPHLALLHIFSHGTYQSYRQTENLPDLNDAQTTKLRQLSLLTIARDRQNLTYEALQASLGLTEARQVEETVIGAVYAGLLDATLNPARQCVQVSSVSSLRDLSPGSIPHMISALESWSSRCTSTLSDLEAQIASIRTAAIVRQEEQRLADEKHKTLMAEVQEADKKSMTGPSRDGMPRRALQQKRGMAGAGDGPSSILLAEKMEMDVDEPLGEDAKKRANKRKI